MRAWLSVYLVTRQHRKTHAPSSFGQGMATHPNKHQPRPELWPGGDVRHCSLVCGKIRWCRRFSFFITSKRKDSCEALVLVRPPARSKEVGKCLSREEILVEGVDSRQAVYLKKKCSVERCNRCVCWWSPVGHTGCQPVPWRYFWCSGTS